MRTAICTLLLCASVSAQEGPVRAIWRRDSEPLGPRKWAAQWIWRRGEPAGENLVWLTRKTFTLKQPAKAARLYITADSHYRLYVNGRFVHRGPARCIPEQQSFDVLDIAALLRPGANVLAILAHHYGVDTVRYNLGRPGVLAQLDLEGETIGTDATWRGHAGDAWEQSTPRVIEWGKGLAQGFTEIADLRQYPAGWETVEFDDSKWEPAGLVKWPANWPVNDPPPTPKAVMRPWVALVPRDLPGLRERPVRAARVVSRGEAIEYRKLNLGGNDVAASLAQDVLVPLQHCRIEGEREFEQGRSPLVVANSPKEDRIVLTDGIRSAHVVLDLGEARNGYARLEISGPRGTRVDVSYAPYLVGGRVVPTFMSMRNADRITLSGRKDLWEALDWRNFRYLALTVRGATRPVEVHFAGMTRVDYPFEKSGALEVEGEPELTALWQAAARTVEVVTTDAYQDNYREQFQYAGTSYYAARANMAAFGDTWLQRRYLTQLPLSMMTDGIMLPAYPGSGDQARRVILEYNLLWIMGLRDYLVYSGDERTAAGLLPALNRLLESFAAMENERGLLDSPPYAYWLDWADIDRRGINFALNAFYLLALEDAAAVLERMKQPGAGLCRWKAAKLRTNLGAEFWDGERRLFADAKVDGKLSGRFSENGNAMALAAGIAAGGQAEGVSRELARGDGSKMGRVSPLFMYWVAEGLFRNGRGREALDLLKRRYAHMLAAGHGTLWEEWSLLAGHAGGGSSRCLAQAEDTYPAYTLTRWLLGVDPVAARGPVLRIRYTECGLRGVRGSIPTARGPATIRWSNQPGARLLETSLPEGITAEVDPGGFTGGGAVTLDGKPWAPPSPGALPKLPSGRHVVAVAVR